MFALIVIIVIVGGFLFAYWFADMNNKADIYQKCLDKHKETLARKFGQSRYVDDYGNVKLDLWFKERDYFIKHVLALEYPNGVNDFNYEAMADSVDKDVIEFYYEQKSQFSESGFASSTEDLSPIEFERYCLQVLENNGWRGRTTRATGDQGVDIIANYGVIKAVFQCKYYSKPVSNSAVQEIAAGMAFEEADLAVVLTNSTFTKSARQLADSLGVHLIHCDEIPRFTKAIDELLHAGDEENGTGA